MLTIGLVAAIWTFVHGARDTVPWVGRTLSSIDITYGQIARVGAGLLCIVAPILALRLWAQNRKRGNLDHSELMKNPRYRKLEEEKWQLERRLREIDDDQLWIGRERPAIHRATIR
jgi:hypothetical protein